LTSWNNQNHWIILLVKVMDFPTWPLTMTLPKFIGFEMHAQPSLQGWVEWSKFKSVFSHHTPYSRVYANLLYKFSYSIVENKSSKVKSNSMKIEIDTRYQYSQFVQRCTLGPNQVTPKLWILDRDTITQYWNYFPMYQVYQNAHLPSFPKYLLTCVESCNFVIVEERDGAHVLVVSRSL